MTDSKYEGIYLGFYRTDTLQAETVIATGTPGGVAMGMKPPIFLRSGDKVTCRIEGIGEIENIIE